MSILSGPKFFIYSTKVKKKKKASSFSVLDACYFLARELLEMHYKAVVDAFSDSPNHFASILPQ